MQYTNGDCIEFESRREIESIMRALGEYLEDHQDDKTVERMLDLLDLMHMNW